MRQSSGNGKREVVRVWLLGRFRVSVGPLTIEEDRWRLRKAGSLVKLLALAGAHRLHREQVMDALWADLDQRSQANNLYRTLHVARRTLGNRSTDTDRRYLSLRGDVVSLYPDGPLWTDVQAFEEATAYASSSGEPAAYRAALDLYAGDLLPEDPYEDWIHARREGLRQMYLDLLVAIAHFYEEREDYTSAIEALRRAVAEEPANEEAHRGLMRVYARGGRRQQALSQYRQLENALGRQLDAKPDPAIRRLHQDIRTNRLADVDPGPAWRVGEAPRINPGNHNLPHAHSSFVGRQRELVEAKRALAMTRTMTLTGAGGCGKTRLALEMARDLVGAYPDGVWLTELAPLSDAALLPRRVCRRLDDSLVFLTEGPRTADPRQQTMRPPLEWSYGLLSGPEQRLFARLSVFSGGWTLKAAEEVCSGAGIQRGQALDLLGKLVDKSLVLAEGRAGARYRMLEPVRQYARERLDESQEEAQVLERHAAYYLALAEVAEPE